MIEAAVDDLVLYEEKSSTTFLNQLSFTQPKLIKITNLLGEVVDHNNVLENTTLFYIYEDGSVEKKILIE